MKVFVSAALVALVTCAIGLPFAPEVVKFSIFEEEEVVIRRPRLQSYTYKNCGSPDKELFNLISLNLSPDPLSFPGPLSVNFSGQIKSTVDAPLKAVVYLGKKVGSTWIKIPCIGQIGSCTYDDLCSSLSNIQCPPEFVSAGVPCKCPFKAGSYKLPTVNFDVGAAVFPPGDYHGQANLTYNNALVGCYEIYVTFA
ncbi:hypothetical protein BaRGS_00017602 [Batillaria attramentaria]|uniref:MD-2-related lipid-recognition domain-containing protein n=1 Tax=Batillaria attramentaria TaxID=370345 RepID=A0ABD0KVH6_9CAEN